MDLLVPGPLLVKFWTIFVISLLILQSAFFSDCINVNNMTGSVTPINRNGGGTSDGIGALYVSCPRGYYATRIGRCQKIYTGPPLWK